MIAKAGACAAALAVLMAGAAGSANAADTMVEMLSSNEFSPETITVHVGDTVTWVNRDAAVHDAAARDPGVSWQTGYIDLGEQVSVPFQQVGTFPYHCRIHPGMTGRISVTSALPTTDAVDAGAASRQRSGEHAMVVAAILGVLLVVGAGRAASRSVSLRD